MIQYKIRKEGFSVPLNPAMITEPWRNHTDTSLYKDGRCLFKLPFTSEACHFFENNCVISNQVKNL